MFPNNYTNLKKIKFDIVDKYDVLGLIKSMKFIDKSVEVSLSINYPKFVEEEAEFAQF